MIDAVAPYPVNVYGTANGVKLYALTCFQPFHHNSQALCRPHVPYAIQPIALWDIKLEQAKSQAHIDLHTHV